MSRIVQSRDHLATEPGTNFRYSRKVHEVRPVNALELTRIEPGFELNDRIIDHIAFLLRRRIGQLAVGEEMSDFLKVDKLHAIAKLRGNAPGILAALLPQ